MDLPTRAAFIRRHAEERSRGRGRRRAREGSKTRVVGRLAQRGTTAGGGNPLGAQGDAIIVGRGKCFGAMKRKREKEIKRAQTRPRCWRERVGVEFKSFTCSREISSSNQQRQF